MPGGTRRAPEPEPFTLESFLDYLVDDVAPHVEHFRDEAEHGHIKAGLANIARGIQQLGDNRRVIRHLERPDA